MSKVDEKKIIGVKKRGSACEGKNTFDVLLSAELYLGCDNMQKVDRKKILK